MWIAQCPLVSTPLYVIFAHLFVSFSWQAFFELHCVAFSTPESALFWAVIPYFDLSSRPFVQVDVATFSAFFEKDLLPPSLASLCQFSYPLRACRLRFQKRLRGKETRSPESRFFVSLGVLPISYHLRSCVSEIHPMVCPPLVCRLFPTLPGLCTFLL